MNTFNLGRKERLKIIEVTTINYYKIINSNKLVMLDFWANWCPHCKALNPIIDKLAASKEDLLIGKVDVEYDEELAENLGVRSMPTLVIFKDGIVIQTLVGFKTLNELETAVGQV